MNRNILFRKSKKNWLRALDDEFVVHWIDANSNDPVTYNEAREAINKLICYNIRVATDEKVNGGYRLIKVEDNE